MADLTAWQRHALAVLRARPNTTLPQRGALVTGARGLIRQHLAETTGIPARYRLTPEGVVAHDNYFGPPREGTKAA